MPSWREAWSSISLDFSAPTRLVARSANAGIWKTADLLVGEFTKDYSLEVGMGLTKWPQRRISLDWGKHPSALVGAFTDISPFFWIIGGMHYLRHFPSISSTLAAIC